MCSNQAINKYWRAKLESKRKTENTLTNTNIPIFTSCKKKKDDFYFYINPFPLPVARIKLLDYSRGWYKLQIKKRWGWITKKRITSLYWGLVQLKEWINKEVKNG